MDGFILINKEENYTSRDVVNIVSKHLNIKKVGHTGTLDPMATGLLIICVGKGTKLIELMTDEDKEYIAEITLGIKTDTGDITGNILNEEVSLKTKEEILNVLNNMTNEYEQTVPIYSAVKIKGKKLYEYARENKSVELPKRLVDIKELELVSDIQYKDNKTIFKVRCLVSKGTYIRSLVEDIGKELGTIGTMSELERTKVGQFKLSDAVKLSDVKSGNYQINPIIDCFSDYNKIIVEDSELLFKIKNGQKLVNSYDESELLFIGKDREVLALYRNDPNKDGYIRPWKMFVK